MQEIFVVTSLVSLAGNFLYGRSSSSSSSSSIAGDGTTIVAVTQCQIPDSMRGSRFSS
jgi:hypothetical protein